MSIPRNNISMSRNHISISGNSISISAVASWVVELLAAIKVKKGIDGEDSCVLGIWVVFSIPGPGRLLMVSLAWLEPLRPGVLTGLGFVTPLSQCFPSQPMLSMSTNVTLLNQCYLSQPMLNLSANVTSLSQCCPSQSSFPLSVKFAPSDKAAHAQRRKQKLVAHP